MYEKLKRDKQIALKQKGKSFSNSIDFGSLAKRGTEKYCSNPRCSEILKTKSKDDLKRQEETLDYTTPNRNKPDKKSPNKIGEIRLNTGTVEIGYDEERDEIVLTFVERHARTLNTREVVEGDTVRRTLTYGSEPFRTNSKSFLGGATSLHTDATHDLVYIEQQMNNFSDEEQNLTTMDDILDFHKTPKSKKENPLPSEEENFRASKNLQFRQKFSKAVNDARQEAKASKFKARDDIIFLYMLKKRLVEEGYYVANTEDIIKEIENETEEQEQEVQEENQKEQKGQEGQQDQEENQ